MAKTSNPLSTNETSKSTNEDRQAGFVEQMANRIRDRAEEVRVSYSDVLRETGVSSSAMANYWTGKRPWPTEHLGTIADLLDTSVDALMGRQRRNHLVSADDADWVDVPEYSLFEIDELGKLAPIVTSKMRKDWLYSSLGETSGLWIAAAPARYEALGIEPMTMIFCKDHRLGERMIHGVHYLFRVNGGVIIARFAHRDDGSDEHTVVTREIGHDDDQYQPVARIVGQFARPI